jgi:hypothetical protein
VRESAISREIVTFLRSLGFAVWSVEQGFRKERGGTRQTPGIPDLIVIGHGRVCFAEVKRPRAKLRPAQQDFRDECVVNGGEWELWRDVTDSFDWCVRVGVLEAA